MHLPSFLWLWRIAAWSMGLAIFVYTILAITAYWLWQVRTNGRSPLGLVAPKVNNLVKAFHYLLGITLIFLVLLLLLIGIVGTLGHFGSLGHSSHLFAGLTVVILVLTSALSATQISQGKFWARPLHITLNAILFFGFAWVCLTGWNVVQKYL
ncbi:DUF4079 domain-containing protein [Cylindrospermopsis raciborskii]|uniref:DUF4079 domain-containing protein n=1 Tax=Cylindrospermopsis raciborskii CS-505 TaxID=533240 RepID=A0A853MCJ9_9CYAN|nr:DUF4079 domain-containing protein [Cylindrospermopsis raciborskii]OBU76155.1 hypothetical protein A9P98_07335 [Cylindrospermopsis raciborskii CS-505]